MTPIPAEVGMKTEVQRLLESVWECKSVYTMQTIVKYVESKLPEWLLDPCKVDLGWEGDD